jgi:phosphatidylglycerophosphate synthase
MEPEQFAGASKTSKSLMTPLEKRLAPVVVPRIPSWLETYHLTMLTLVWCVLIVYFSYLAARDIRWLWLVSLMVFFQYLTDHFDGKVGKHRRTGLVKWGFYMDHILDYAFLCSVLIGYALILPERSRFHVLLLLAVTAGFMINAFLAFSATERFQISFMKVGPTEFRIFLIIVNALLVLFGQRYMISSLPYVTAGCFVALCLFVYRTQKKIWKSDVEYKRRHSGENKS